MLTLEALRQFSGSKVAYKHPLSGRVYTEGLKYMADEADAYWLIDEILINQTQKKIREQEFQVWILEVKDNKATLRCEDGNDNLVWFKNIEFTDFPLPKITLWYSNRVLYLPSEH